MIFFFPSHEDIQSSVVGSVEPLALIARAGESDGIIAVVVVPFVVPVPLTIVVVCGGLSSGSLTIITGMLCIYFWLRSSMLSGSLVSLVSESSKESPAEMNERTPRMMNGRVGWRY